MNEFEIITLILIVPVVIIEREGKKPYSNAMKMFRF